MFDKYMVYKQMFRYSCFFCFDENSIVTFIIYLKDSIKIYKSGIQFRKNEITSIDAQLMNGR